MSDMRINVMTISGEAKVRAANDIASIPLSIITKHKKSKEARRENTEKMGAIFDILENSGVEKKYYQTSGYTYCKWIEYVVEGKGKNRKQVARDMGYQVHNHLNITLKNLDVLDDLYDALAEAGCTELGSPVFNVGSVEDLVNEARKVALQNALIKAQLYADVAGIRIVGMTSFSEQQLSADEGDRARVTTMSYAAAPESVSGSAAINPGSKQIIIRVNCTFEITNFKFGSSARKAAKRAKKVPTGKGS